MCDLLSEARAAAAKRHRNGEGWYFCDCGELISRLADEVERLRRLLTPVRPDTDIEEGKPLSTPNDYLSLLSSYIADYMPSEAVPDDEYFGAWERAARPILQRLFDEIERLRALSVRATEKE